MSSSRFAQATGIGGVSSVKSSSRTWSSSSSVACRRSPTYTMPRFFSAVRVVTFISSFSELTPRLPLLLRMLFSSRARTSRIFWITT